MNLHDRWILSCASWQCHGTWRQSKPGQRIRNDAKRRYQNFCCPRRRLTQNHASQDVLFDSGEWQVDAARLGAPDLPLDTGNKLGSG